MAVTFTALGVLQEALHTLERVHTTPLPFAYQAHLKASIWVFLLFLPFQIYDALGYVTIAATFITATIYLGFLEIANQVENPFGYDDSDLDLDHFCALIAAELREIVAHPQPDPEQFVTSPLNQPFWPTDQRTATDILQDFDPLHTSSTTASETAQEAHKFHGEAGVRKLAAHVSDELSVAVVHAADTCGSRSTSTTWRTWPRWKGRCSARGSRRGVGGARRWR